MGRWKKSNRSIFLSLVWFAADEGSSTALEKCEEFKLVLQELAEICSKDEEKLVLPLLERVVIAEQEITSGPAVEIARNAQNEDLEEITPTDKLQQNSRCSSDHNKFVICDETGAYVCQYCGKP